MNARSILVAAAAAEDCTITGTSGDDVVAGGPNAALLACGEGTDRFVTDGPDDVHPSCEQEGVGNGQPEARTAGAHERP